MNVTRQKGLHILIVQLFLSILVLSACSPRTTTQPSQTGATDVPEAIIEPTQAPTPEIIPTESMPVAMGTAYPQTAGTFGLDEVEPVLELARWGEGNLNDVALSPDGQTLAAGFSTGLKLFEVDTLEEMPSLLQDQVEILEIQFSADGKYLALVTDYQVLVYDWKTKALTATIETDHDQGMHYWPMLFNLSFSKDGKTLAALVNNRLHLMDPASGAENLAATELLANAAFYSQDDQSLILIESGETSHQIVFVDAQSLEETYRLDLQDYASNAYLSADHHYLAAGLSRTNEVVIVDLENQIVTSTINQSNYYDSAIYSYTTAELTFSPDSKWLVGRFGGSDRLMVWDVAAGRATQNGILFTGYGSKFTFSPDGSQLFGFMNESGKDGYSVWNTSTWEWEFSEAEVAASEVLFPSQDAYLLVENTKTISQYWAEYPKLQTTNDFSFVQFSLKKYEPDLSSFDLGAEIYRAEYLDENTLLTNTDQGIQIRDAGTYEVLREVSGEIYFGEISADKSTLAAVLPDQSIQLYALPELTPGRLISGQNGNILRLFLEPEGKTLIVTSDPKTVGTETVVWDCASGERLGSFENAYSTIYYYFLPGEIYGVAPDFSLVTWDPSSGEQVHTYMGSTVEAEGMLAVNPGGENTFGVAKEGIYRLEWSAYPSTYKMVEHSFDQVLQMAISDNEERLAVLAPEGIEVFNLVKGELVKNITGDFASIAFIPGSEDLLAAESSKLIVYSDDLPAAARSEKFFYTEGLRDPQFIVEGSPYAPAGVQEAKDLVAMVSPNVNGDFYYDPLNGDLDWVGLHDIYYGYGVDQYSPIITAWSPDGANQASLVTNEPYVIYVEVNPPTQEREDEPLAAQQRTLTDCRELNDLSIKMADNGRVVVECGSYSEGYSLYLYEGNPLELVETIDLGSTKSESLALSADGSRLAYVHKVEDAYRYEFKLIDLEVPGESKVLISLDQGDVTGGNYSIESLAFDLNGELLAVGGTNGSILLLNAATLAHLATIEGHSRAVDGLMFFNDNQNLLSTSADGTIRVWGVGDLVE